MNKLWVFGDSFSTNHNGKINTIWPEIVSSHLGLELINTARGGCGNDEIYEKIAINMHKINEGDYAIIGMTNPLRYSLYLRGELRDVSPHWDYPIEDKLVRDYYFKIRSEAFDEHEERMINRIIGLQKELSKRSIKSMLWHWYENKSQSYQSPVAYSKYSVKDSHFSDKGHKQFADRILYKIEQDVSHWTNIYEKIDNLNRLI
jgi:hypothetical protein|tara:strand:- start:353 stop:961 length:609 start_codon:yes stop_codon:yes gene_type:complete